MPENPTPPTTAQDVAKRIYEQMNVFADETWPHEERKKDVLLGMNVALRIARGQEVSSPKNEEQK